VADLEEHRESLRARTEVEIARARHIDEPGNARGQTSPRPDRAS
jgi:hypothetical protein